MIGVCITTETFVDITNAAAGARAHYPTRGRGAAGAGSGPARVPNAHSAAVDDCGHKRSYETDGASL